MKYDKGHLSFEDQAGLLIQRGLVADEVLLISRLGNINYYRLSGYLYPYRQADNTFKPGTTLERVWRHYTFDRRFRLAVMDAIERFEVSVRTQLIYELSRITGAFGYGSPAALPRLSPAEYARWIEEIKLVSFNENIASLKFNENTLFGRLAIEERNYRGYPERIKKPI